MDNIARIIAAYDRQGIHRTGTDVDNASARWLAEEITQIGATPRLVPFPLERMDVIAARATVAGISYEGLPLFDGAISGADGVAGQLGRLGSGAPIALVTTGALADQTVETAREEGGYQAILVITVSEPPGLTPINADKFSQPFGPPVLQLSSEYRDTLEREANAQADATVVIDAQRKTSTALNVTAQIEGRKPALAPVIVMTPRSGWWNCASERGGGLVLFLEIMRAVRDAHPARTVIFTANSGHELGHLGLDRFIEDAPHLVKEAACWVHLGANFAAAVGPQVRLQATDGGLLARARTAMREQDVTADVETPVGQRPRGEARNIFDGGGRYVSLLGGNGLFHHQDDRWPAAVDVRKTGKLAAAFCNLTVDLANG
jgi:hypothetical protein